MIGIVGVDVHNMRIWILTLVTGIISGIVVHLCHTISQFNDGSRITSGS